MVDPLRKKAEELLNRNPRETPVLATTEARKLFHELDVHQVELQMQNEELRGAQEKLAHSRDAYAELYDFAPVGYLTLDLEEGRILDANFAAASLLGVERGKQMIGRTFAGFVQRDSLDQWELHRRLMLESQKKHRAELSLQRSDGGVVGVHLECSPRLASGRVLLTLVDISDRLKTEEELRRLTAELEQRVEQRTAALRESEERFRLMFEEAPDAHFLVDMEGRFFDGNKAVKQQFGYDREELIGQVLCESGIFSPDDRAAVAERIDRLGRGEKLGPVEFSLRRKDGTAIPVEVSSMLIRIDETPILLCSSRDLTARKLTERELVESETRFRELFERMGSGVAIYEARDDGAEFVFNDINAAGERISGVKRAEVLGRGVRELFPAIQEMGLYEVFQRVWRTGEPENRPLALYQDGRIRQWVENRVYKLPSNELVAIYDDHTARKLAEQGLSESEEKYRGVFESESDAILIFDAETRRFLDANSAAEKLYGHTREEFLQLVQKEVSAEPLASDASIDEIIAGRLTSIPVRMHRKKDGTVFPVEIMACTFYLKDRRVICEVSRDITLRTRQEEEILRNREELRRLASELSLAEQRERQRVAAELHDGVSQMLSSACLRLGILRETALPASTGESLEIIDQIVGDTLRQVRSLTFELSCPMLSELGLAAALEELCATMSRAYTVRFVFAGDTRPLPLPCDQQVVLYRSVRELLINVMKHAEARSARVELEYHADQLRIRIADDGKGFDATMAGRGFSPSGGFGLFNLREYSHHAGGTLEIKSEPDRGTQVALTIPVEEDNG